MLFVLLLFNFLYIYFFVYIGLWFLSFIPGLFLLFVLINSSDIFSGSLFSKKQLKGIILDNIMFVMWVLIMIGVSGLLYYLDLVAGNIHLIIFFNLIFNFFLLVVSEISDYNDGVYIFHKTYLLSNFVLVGWIFYSLGFGYTFLKLLFYIVGLNLGVYSFIYFSLKSVVKVENFYKNFFVFFLNIFVLGSFFILFDSKLIAGLAGQIYLMLIYFSYWYLLERKELIKNIEDKELNHEKKLLQDILEGKKVFQKDKSSKNISLWIQIGEFLDSIPDRLKFFIVSLNLFFVFLQIYLFFTKLGDTSWIYYEILYWSSIIIFFINYFLIEKVKLYHNIQRFFSFLIINFAIYLTVINIFGENILYIVIVGVSRDFINTIGIHISQKFIKKFEFFYQEDYRCWTIANICIAFVNSWFIYQLDFDTKIKIFSIMIYLGVQFFMATTNIKNLENIDI